MPFDFGHFIPCTRLKDKASLFTTNAIMGIIINYRKILPKEAKNDHFPRVITIIPWRSDIQSLKLLLSPIKNAILDSFLPCSNFL